MIYTVTTNPAIDYVVHVEGLISGETNRSQQEQYYFGGKGINVSTILGELGIENVALGFVSGFTGDALEQGLKEQGIRTDFIHLKEGITRINIKIKSNKETEINSKGPNIDDEAKYQLMKQMDALTDGDVLVLSGNIPGTLTKCTYQTILESLEDRDILKIVDATGELLLKTLPFKPFLIKPNKSELEGLFDMTCTREDIIIECASKLQEQGARNVLVSMGAKGALLLCENGKTLRCVAPEGKIINTVGAGDSMVAGFIAGYLSTSDYEYALQLGSAAGTATACSAGLASIDEINYYLHQLRKDGI